MSDPTTQQRTEILAVEDEPLNLRLLHAILEREGYEVLDARSLAEARELLADRRPQLILLDLRLPDGNGLELARELKADEEMRRIPVVAASADALPPIVMAAFQAGVDGFLAKPIRPADLLAEVRRQIDGTELADG